MADVFISYSRRDKEFVEKIATALVQDGRNIWIDWEDIPRAADWLNEIDKGIENAAAFVFVVSRHSLSSEICNHELSYALELNKRIVPLIREDITNDIHTEVIKVWTEKDWQNSAQENWTAISHLNWIFFNTDEDDNFQKEFKALLTTLDVDLEHIKLHTRILVREREWEDNVRKPSYLLNGDEINEAETWLAKATTENKLPAPGELHRLYITESREVENHRLENLRRLETRTKQFRMAAGILAIAIIGAIIAVIFAINQTNQATQRAAIAATDVQNANVELGIAEQRVDDANATLSPIPPTLTQAANDVVLANQSVDNANATLMPIPPTLTQAANDVESANIAVDNANATLMPIPPTLTQAANDIASANEQVANADFAIATADSLVVDAQSELTSIPPTLEALDIQIALAEDRVQSLNLAAEALDLGAAASESFNEGQSELAALLAIRSLQIAYNSAADSALVGASNNLYAEVLIIPDGQLGNFSHGAMSPNAETIIFGYDDGGISFYDVSTNTMRDKSIDAHDADIIASIFTPDSKLALSGDFNGDLVIWNPTTGEILETFEDLHDFGISDINISRNGELIATGGGDGNICIIEVDNFDLDYCFNTGIDDYVYGLDFGEDDNTLLATYGVGADFWELDNDDTTEFMGYYEHRLGTYDVAYDPNGDYVLTVSDDESMILWDLEDGYQIRSFEDNSNIMTHGLFSPDGRYAFTASVDGTPRMWDVENGRVVRRFGGHSQPIANITLSEDGRYLFSVAYDGTARIWNADITETTGVFRGHNDWVVRLSFSPDGRYVASAGGADYTARIWDTIENRLYDTVEVDEYNIEGISFLPDGSGVIFDYEDELSFWDADSGDVDDRYFNIDNWATKIRITNDAQYAVTFTYESSVDIITLDDGENEQIAEGFIYDMSLAVDANIIAYLEDTKTIVLYSIDDQEEINRFDAPMDTSALGLSPDGTLLLLGGYSGDVMVVDTVTGEVLMTNITHTAYIASLEVSFDGLRAVSASSDERVIIWDLTTLDIERIYINHTNEVREAIFSPDGQRVASSGVDRTLQVWFVELDDVVDNVCTTIIRDLTLNERARYGITDITSTCP